LVHIFKETSLKEEETVFLRKQQQQQQKHKTRTTTTKVIKPFELRFKKTSVEDL